MLRILKAESCRLWSRRCTRGTLLLLACSLLLAAFLPLLLSRRVPASVSDSLDRQLVKVESYRAEFIKTCRQGNEGAVASFFPQTSFQCDRRWNAVLARNDPDRFHLARLQDGLIIMSPLLMIVAYLLGCTISGAEWASGSLATTLTWEPSRIRLMLGRVIAGVTWTLAVSVLWQVLLALAMIPGTLARGSLHNVDWAWVWSSLLLVIRSGSISGLGFSMGFAVATLSRNTAAAGAVGLLTLFAQEIVEEVDGLRVLLISHSVEAFAGTSAGGGTSLSTGQALFQILAHAIVLLIVATVDFERRDLTSGFA